MDKSSALEYINQMFPNGNFNFNFTFIVFNYNRKVLLIDNRFLNFVTEASLSGVEPLMQKIQNEIRTVDAGILSAVRQQVFHFSINQHCVIRFVFFCALIMPLFLSF